MKVETNHYSYIMTANLIGRALILVKMSVEIFKTHVHFYFFYRQHSCVSHYCHYLLISSHNSVFNEDFFSFSGVLTPLSAIFQRPVLVVEVAGAPGENHRPWTSNWYKLYHLRLRVECTLFCNLQIQARTHAVLVIGLYELLGNPTT